MRVRGELRRGTGPDGRTQVITRSVAPELLALAQREPALRLEALSLEDLFVEVTR